jgi:hypothetical protein
MSQKKIPKINRDSGKGATGYQWDLGREAFGERVASSRNIQTKEQKDKYYQNKKLRKQNEESRQRS